MNNALVNSQEGIQLLGCYLLVLLATVIFSHRGKKTSEEFLVYRRELGTFRGALSIAAAWIWAPAVFVCSLKSYTQGVAGIFWFTVPNVLCFFTFTPLAVKLRKLCPNGYTWPDFVWTRYNGDKRVHIASLVVYFGYDLAAITSNCLAGGTLLNILTGADFSLAVIMMSFGALTYSLISGFRASVLTDVIQMVVILAIGVLIVPWVVSAIVKQGPISLNYGLSRQKNGRIRAFRNTTVPASIYTISQRNNRTIRVVPL